MEGVARVQSVIEIAVSLGLATAIGVTIRYAWNRWRWKRFKRLVRRWLALPQSANEKHPKQMTEDDWCFQIEKLLGRARFSVFEIQELREFAIVIAKGIIGQQLFLG